MKARPIVIILLTTVYGSPLAAQARAGGHLGLSLSTMSEPDNLVPGSQWLYKFGFIAGVSSDLRLGTSGLLSARLGYSQKGMKAEVPFPPNPSTTVTNDYLEMGLVYRFTFAGPLIPWYLQAGPSIAYLLSSETEVDVPRPGPKRYSSLDSFERFDAGLSIGIGSEYKISEALALDYSLNFCRGLTRVLQNSSSPRNQSFQLIIGILYTMPGLNAAG